MFPARHGKGGLLLESLVGLGWITEANKHEVIFDEWAFVSMRLGQLSEGIVDDWSKLSADAKRAVLKKDAAFPEEQLDFAFVEAAIKFRELSQNALDTGDYSKTAFGLLNESGISIDALYANGLLQKKQVGDYVVEEGHATREQVSMAVRMQAIDRLDLWAAAFEAGRGLNAEALAVARGADRQALDIANPPEEKWIQFEKNPAAKREQAAASMTKMLVALVERAPALKDDPTVQQAFAAAMHLHANSLLEVTQAMEASHAPAAVVAGLKQEQGLLLVQPGGVNENLAQAVANGVLAATERLRADKTFSDAQAFTLIGWATTRAEQAQTPDAAKYRAAITGFFAQVNEQATGNGARAM